MKRFKSSEQAQHFLSVFESINAPFRLRRHLLSAARYRLLLNRSVHLWNRTVLAAHLLHSSRSEAYLLRLNIGPLS
jgi:putative transposase